MSGKHQPGPNATFAAKMSGGSVRYYKTRHAADCAMKASGAAKKQWGHRKKAHPNGKQRPRPDANMESAYPFYEQTNSAEKTFLRFARTKGLHVHRNGWPDFFCENPNGGLAAVEVKRGVGDKLRPEQVECMRLLARAGIETFIWNQAESKAFSLPALVPFEQYVSGWPGTDLGAKAIGQAHTSVESDLESQTHANPVPEDGRIPEVLDDPRTVH